jgi:flavin reductase (DIM6/NTAB) family NADH-FMN oxidoreductase RutF
MPIEATRIDTTHFRELFRHHAGGVVVITLDAGTGPAGFTATSLASVSLAPPLVTFAISATSSTWPHLRAADTLVVNFLGHDDHELARTFATSGVDRFAAPVEWRRLGTGEPVLEASRRWLRGAVRERIQLGDHHLIVVEILHIELSPGDRRSALVYHRGDYHPVGHTPLTAST